MCRKFVTIFFSIFFLLAEAIPSSAAPYFWSVFGAESGLTKPNLKSLSVDPGGYLWMGSHDTDNGSSGGVTIFAGNREIVTYGSDNGLCGNAVNAIAFENVAPENINDPAFGAVWIATGKGITVLDRKGLFTRITPGNSPLPGRNINMIMIDDENTKWISAWGNGISCVDSQYNWAKYIRSPEGLCSNKILAIKAGRNGNVWFGSMDNGASRIDREGNWQRFSKINSGLIGNCVRDIETEEPNKTWFVTTEGISVFDGQNWMSYTSRNSPLGDFIPSAMVVDREGNKWIATENGGVFKLDSFGMWTRFHKGNSSLIDDRVTDLLLDASGTVWIATSSGLCSIARFTGSPGTGSADTGFKAGDYFPSANGSYLPFEHALIWKSNSGGGSDPDLSFSLPAFFSGGERWFYAAFWAEGGFDFSSFEYEISGSRKGNFKITFNGPFETAKFLVSGGLFSLGNHVSLDKRLKYPFPENYPDLLKPFLLPGKHIPGSDPEMKELVRTLVREKSQDDMFMTIKDIVYSGLMQNLKSDNQTLEDRSDGAFSGGPEVKGVYDVLKDGSGSQHSKSRLVCTLSRAAGVPSRVVMSLGGHVWAEVWISGAGWIPVEVSYPAFDYLRTQRTTVPKIFTPDECTIASVSGKDDEVSRITWNERFSASYSELDSSELKKYSNLSGAKLLLLKISPGEKPPENSLPQIAENIYIAALQRGGETLLVFQDAGKKEIGKIALDFNGLPAVAQVGDKLFWKLVPKRIGDILVIESLEYSASE